MRFIRLYRYVRPDGGVSISPKIPLDSPYTRFTRIIADEEKALIRKIAEYPELINEAAKEYSPFKLTKYVYELAQIFHKFYDSCGIKDAEKDVKLSRLALCEATKTVIKNVLTLLKIDAPEKM